MAQQRVQQSGEDVLLELASRVRSMEGQYNLLRDRTLLVNQNLVTSHKKAQGDLQSVASDIAQLKHDIFALKETVRHLVGELQQFARTEEVKVLEKYINLWNPMRFVTEDDVKKIMEHHGRSL